MKNKKKNKEKLSQEQVDEKIKLYFEDKCKDMSWDDLAYQIIMLEKAIDSTTPKDPEVQKTLKITLDIYEQEKSIRIGRSFDYERMLYREYPAVISADSENDDFLDS